MALPTQVQQAVQAEAQALIIAQTATQTELSKAVVTVVAPITTQQQTINQSTTQEITTRLTEPQQGTGIRVGRIRDIQEDLVNQTILRNVVSDKLTQASIVVAAGAQPHAPSTVSHQQAVAVAQSQIVISKQRQRESDQALQTLQRTCNHKFDKSSRRCLYCSKHRDSHVYDEKNKILRNSS